MRMAPPNQVKLQLCLWLPLHCIQLWGSGSGSKKPQRACSIHGGAAFNQQVDALPQGGENGLLSYSLLQVVLWIQENKVFHSLAVQPNLPSTPNKLPLPGPSPAKFCLMKARGGGGLLFFLFCLLLLLYLCLVFSNHPSLSFSK